MYCNRVIVEQKVKQKIVTLIYNFVYKTALNMERKGLRGCVTSD